MPLRGLRVLTVAAVAALTGGALLLASPASAIECPSGTDARTVRVAGRTTTVCVPGIYCFPAPCDPWFAGTP